MRTGGPAKTTAALKRVAEGMTSKQERFVRKSLRRLYDHPQQHAEQRAGLNNSTAFGEIECAIIPHQMLGFCLAMSNAGPSGLLIFTQRSVRDGK
jgi:hypothetical protein